MSFSCTRICCLNLDLFVTRQLREMPNWMFAPATSSWEFWALRRLCGWGGAKFCSPEDSCGFVRAFGAFIAHFCDSLSLSLMFIFANGTGRSKISRGHWTLVLVSAWFLPVDKVSSYTNHLNLGLLERRWTSGSLLMASTKIYVKCQLNIHHRRLQILSTSTPVDTSDQQRRDDQPMPVWSTISTVVKTKMK